MNECYLCYPSFLPLLSVCIFSAFCASSISRIFTRIEPSSITAQSFQISDCLLTSSGISIPLSTQPNLINREKQNYVMDNVCKEKGVSKTTKNESRHIFRLARACL